MVRACLVYIFFKLFFRTFFKNTKNNKKVLSENSYLFFKFIFFFYVFQEKENWKPNKFFIFFSISLFLRTENSLKKKQIYP